MRYDGTQATLIGRFYMGDQELQIHDHLTGRVEAIRPTRGALAATGHGGGDAGLMAGLARAVRDRSQARTTARQSLESHLMAFAAEEARQDGTVVHMDKYRGRAEETGKTPSGLTMDRQTSA
jgi:hypothetical protein